ncbi:MAG: hypothetical protein IKF14_02115 [Atopobiaceae bacterium]|nr:hypothetical protein [Atopobiaceae bacterium]
MQIVKPIDIEVAVAQELAAALGGTTVTAYPPPDNISSATVSIYALGGVEQSVVSDEHDFVAYVWADTYGEAMAVGAEVCGLIRALRFNGGSASGAVFTTAEARPPYEDPDPLRPTLKRATVRATVGARGIAIIDNS